MKLEEFMRLHEIEKIKSKQQRRTTSQNFNPEQEVNIELTRLWESNSEDEWNAALKKYWGLVKPEDIILEEAME